ncbi:MAG: DUF4191 domain-containing protein [Gammaproteobacteria bacterium]|nr:DUF4191 domain-containing protein [Gammaproteobacteria bacterium]
MAEVEKEPGRMTQLWRVFQMTRKADKALVPILIVAFVVPVVLGIVLPLTIIPSGIFGLVLWIITGVLGGVLLALVILGNRAETMAYKQIEGQSGAVGAVLQNGLRRAWQAQEYPVAVNPRTRDAVYRAVGKCGVVLISEGSKARAQKLINDERRHVQRAVPQVTIHVLHVGSEEDAVSLRGLRKAMNKLKKELNKAEVLAVANRLESLKKPGDMPIPKGIDPYKMRAPKPR